MRTAHFDCKCPVNGDEPNYTIAIWNTIVFDWLPVYLHLTMADSKDKEIQGNAHFTANISIGDIPSNRTYNIIFISDHVDCAVWALSKSPGYAHILIANVS